MNAHPTVPSTRLSLPALLVAAAGTVVVVSVAVVGHDEGSLVERSSATTQPAGTDRYNAGDAYAWQLEMQHLRHQTSLHER